MKKLKSKIDFKPSNMDAFDCEKLPSRYLLDEAGQWATPDPNFNYRDIIKKAKENGKNIELKFAKPKNKKK